MKLAQGIICGPWALAFSFDWARQLVERFELSAIPKAPGWLAGAANVDGNIIPVIDLAQYFSPEIATLTTASTQRLLVGGVGGAAGGHADASTADTEDAIGILFGSLPQQLRYEPQSLTYASALPMKLREVCDAVAADASGLNYLEINTARLMAMLSDELSLL